MDVVLDKERHRQQLELLREQNKITEQRITETKDLERRLKALVSEWKRAEDKGAVIRLIQDLLFKQKENQFVGEKGSKED